MRNLRSIQRASRHHHLVLRGQPQLQSLLLLLSIAEQQVTLQELTLAILCQQVLLRVLVLLQVLLRLQALLQLQALLRLQVVSLHLILQRFKLLVAQELTEPQQEILQLMPLQGQQLVTPQKELGTRPQQMSRLCYRLLLVPI